VEVALSDTRGREGRLPVELAGDIGPKMSLSWCEATKVASQLLRSGG
jgi:hypothetical protein